MPVTAVMEGQKSTSNRRIVYLVLPFASRALNPKKNLFVMFLETGSFDGLNYKLEAY
jgi:hypothetical protein